MLSFMTKLAIGAAAVYTGQTLFAGVVDVKVCGKPVPPIVVETVGMGITFAGVLTIVKAISANNA
jgi:hypothetical protein